MLGPAVIAGLTVRPTGRWRLLVVPALAAVAVADLSGLSKGEVERIWLPFMPWITLAVVACCRGASGRGPGRWLAAQAGLAIAPAGRDRLAVVRPECAEVPWSS